MASEFPFPSFPSPKPSLHVPPVVNPHGSTIAAMIHRFRTSSPKSRQQRQILQKLSHPHQEHPRHTDYFAIPNQNNPNPVMQHAQGYGQHQMSPLYDQYIPDDTFEKVVPQRKKIESGIDAEQEQEQEQVDPMLTPMQVAERLQLSLLPFFKSLGHEVLENTNQDSPTRELVSPENTARMANQLESLARQLSMRLQTEKVLSSEDSANHLEGNKGQDQLMQSEMKEQRKAYRVDENSNRWGKNHNEHAMAHQAISLTESDSENSESSEWELAPGWWKIPDKKAMDTIYSDVQDKLSDSSDDSITVPSPKPIKRLTSAFRRDCNVNHRLNSNFDQRKSSHNQNRSRHQRPPLHPSRNKKPYNNEKDRIRALMDDEQYVSLDKAVEIVCNIQPNTAVEKVKDIIISLSGPRGSLLEVSAEDIMKSMEIACLYKDHQQDHQQDHFEHGIDIDLLSTSIPQPNITRNNVSDFTHSTRPKLERGPFSQIPLSSKQKDDEKGDEDKKIQIDERNQAHQSRKQVWFGLTPKNTQENARSMHSLQNEQSFESIENFGHDIDSTFGVSDPHDAHRVSGKRSPEKLQRKSTSQVHKENTPRADNIARDLVSCEKNESFEYGFPKDMPSLAEFTQSRLMVASSPLPGEYRLSRPFEKDTTLLEPQHLSSATRATGFDPHIPPDVPYIMQNAQHPNSMNSPFAYTGIPIPQNQTTVNPHELFTTSATDFANQPSKISTLHHNYALQQASSVAPQISTFPRPQHEISFSDYLPHSTVSSKVSHVPSQGTHSTFVPLSQPAMFQSHSTNLVQQIPSRTLDSRISQAQSMPHTPISGSTLLQTQKTSSANHIPNKTSYAETKNLNSDLSQILSSVRQTIDSSKAARQAKIQSLAKYG